MARAYLSGLPELKAKLIRMKEETAPAVRAAMADEAEKIVQQMRRLVPKETGKLRDSIGWSWGPAPEGSVFSTSSRSGENTITLFAGSKEAWYVRFVEFGTASHPQGGSHEGTEHPGIAPQPFFYPVWRAMRKQFKARIRKAIKDAVRDAIR